jgi:hypothetical protein
VARWPVVNPDEAMPAAPIRRGTGFGGKKSIENA